MGEDALVPTRMIRVFSELQMWIHIHLIHFAAAFIITGLPLISQDLFWWIAYGIGYPFYKAFPGYTPISAGVLIANWVHRASAFILIFLIAIYVIAELFRIRKWEFGPVEWSFKALKEGFDSLLNYYLFKKHVKFGKYNLGQKLWIIGVVIGLIWMYITGTILWLQFGLSKEIIHNILILHDIGFYLAVIGLLVHVYLATGIPEHRPMVTAMFRTGSIPEAFAKDHHPLYYEKIRKEPIE